MTGEGWVLVMWLEVNMEEYEARHFLAGSLRRVRKRVRGARRVCFCLLLSFMNDVNHPCFSALRRHFAIL